MDILAREDGDTIVVINGHRRLMVMIELNGEAEVTLAGSGRTIVVTTNENGDLVKKPQLPSIEEALALNDKLFAMLSEREKAVYDYFVSHGRKLGVVITINSDVPPEEMAKAKGREQIEEVLRRSNSSISVNVAH